METLMPPAELETGSALVTVSGVASQSCRDESTFARSSLDNLSAADTLAHPSSSLPFLNAGTLSPYSMPGVIYSSGKISPTPSCRSMGRSPSPMQPDTSTKLKTLTPFVLRNRRDEPRSSSAERLSASVDELAAMAASLVSGVSRRSPLGRIREGVPASADASTEEEEKTITTDNSVELNRKLEGLQEAAKIGAPATTQATKTTPSLLQAAAATGGGEQGHEPVPAPPEEERRSSRDRTQVVVDESRTRQRPTIFSDIRERVFGPQQTTQEPLGGRRQPPPPWPDKKPVSVSRQNEEVAKTTEKPAELDPKSAEEFSSTWQDSGADDVVWKRREEADDGVVWKKQQAEDLGKSYAAKVTEPVKVTDNQDAQKQPGANQALEPVDKTQEEAKHPVESSSKPVESSPKPVESSSKPVESSPKPVESSPKPVESSSKAVEGTAEKVASEPPVESPSSGVAIETSRVVPQPPVIVVEPVGDGKDQTDLKVKATPVQTSIPVGQQVPAEQGTDKAGEKAVSVADFGGKQLEDKEPENTDNQTKMLSTEQRDKMNLERRRQLMDRMAAKRAQTLKGLQKKMEDAIDIASHFKPVDMGTVFTRPDKQTTASAENDARQPTANVSRPATLPQGTLILYQQGEPMELLKRADSAEALARQSHAQRLSKEGAFLADSIAAQNAAVALAKSQPTLVQIGGLEARGFTKALTVKEPQPGVRGAGGISPSQLFTSTSTSARKPDKDPGVVPPKTQQPVKTGATPPTIGQPVVKGGTTLSAATRPVAMTAAVAPAVTQPIVRTGPPPPAVTQPVIKTGAVPPAIIKPVTQPVVKTGTVPPTVIQPVLKTGTVAPPITQPVVKTGAIPPPVTQPVVRTGTVAPAIIQPVVKTGTVAPATIQPVVKTGTAAPPVTQTVLKAGATPQPATQSVVKTGTVAPPVTQPVVKPGAIPPTVTQPVVKTGTVPPAVTQPDVRAPAVSPAATQIISRTGVVPPAGVQPGVKSESVPLVVTRSEPKPSSALLISPKSRVDWAKQKFASSDVLDPNFGLSVEPVSSKTPTQQQETDLPATTTIPVTKEVSLQVRQGSELSEDFRGAPENKSAPAVELSSATSYIELTQIAEITPCVAPPTARQIVQQPSVKPPVTAPDFPAMGQQAPSLQTTAKPPDTPQSPALQITQQSVVAKPPAAAPPGPALQITQQSMVKPPVVNQAQPVTTAVTPPRVQVISQQVATRPQPPVSPHLQITQTSTLRAAETQQQTTQTPFGSSFTRPEQPPPPPPQQQQQPASIAPTARQPAPSATIIRSAPDHPGAQTTQRPPTGIQISTSSKQILPPSVVMETRQTDAETRPVRDQPPGGGAVDPRVRGQGSRPTPAQEEPRTVPILMRVPSATDRTESVVCNPIVYAYVSDPDVQEIRMSVREEVKPAIVLEPDVPESRLVTVLPAAGSGSGLRGSAPLQETRTTPISNELYKQTSPLGRPGEASNVSNAGQTRTRVFDPPLVPEVPLSPAAIWSNTSITLNQQFPPAEDATTRDRPVPRTTTTTTTAATSHVGGYSGQGQGQIEAAQPQTKVRFQPAPTAETQRVRSAEAVQPPDRIAGHHRHHIAEGSRDAKDEDSLMIIRAPAHGSGSDPGQTRLVSSLQLQPKTEPAPISPPAVQAASHRNPAPDQRDRKLPEESSRFSIPISVESSAKKTAAAAAPVQVRHHATQDQAKQPLTPAADPHHRQVTIGAAVDAGKQQQQQLTVKDEPKSGPPSPRPGGGTEGDKGHQLGTNLSRVMEVLAKKETEAKKPVKKGLDSMGKSLDGSGAIRKQLIQMESALHPSSAYRSETVPPRRSPRLLRKPKPLLSKSQTIDVSGLKAERELAVFLKTRKEVSSSDDEDISRSRSPRRTSTETRDLDFGNCDLKTVSVLDRIKVMETKVGKTFFSALRAQATAFRAAQAASEDQQQQQQRSEEEKRVDRLANFALISDVSVGQRRRQFMTKRHQTTKARSNSLPRTYDEFVQAENHPGVERLRTDVLSRHPWSYPLRCLHRQPRPAPRRRSVRRRSLPVHLDRLPPDTAGPPRPPSGHGPHRPPPSRLLAAPAISVISEEAVESPPVQAQAYPLPPLPPGFREATRAPASSSGPGRLRIEMPPSPAIDVTGIVPGSELSTPSTPLSANIGWARGEGGQQGPGGGGGRLGMLRRRSADMMDSDDEFDKMVEINIKELGVGVGAGVGAGVGRVGGTPDSKAQPSRQPLQRQPPPTQQQPLSVQHAHPMQQQQQAATQQRQQQPPQQQQQPQQQQSGQLRQIEHQAPSSSSSLTASQQPHRPQQQQQQSAPDLAEVQSPTDSFTLQPIASRVKEWDAAIAEEKAAARAQQLLLLQDPKADVDHLGIKRAAPEARSPRLSTENRKSIGSEFLTEGGVQEGPEGQSEDELSKLSLAEKLKFFSALTTTQPPEPPPPTSKRGKGKRTQTRHQTQYEDQQPVTSEEVEQAVSSRQQQHPHQQQQLQQQQQQYEHQQYQPQQQYQQQLIQQQYYQQQQYQQPQYQQQQQYLQQYQQPPYQDQQYFQQYQQPLYQHQQYQQHMYQQQQTYNPVASRHIYRDY